MSNILPLRKLKDFEVRNTLNKFGGRTDNVLGSKYKASANINKWAKYKPVSYPIPFILSEQELKQANYGLSAFHIGHSTTPQQLMDEAIKGTDFYPYVPPTGGERSPYRISDFRGYNPDAEAPYIMQCYDTAEFVSFPAEIVYNLRENDSVNSEIKITDLAAFEDAAGLTGRFGVLWTAEDGFYYLYYAPSVTIKEGISLNLEVMKPGTYHFLAVWFEAAVGAGNNDITSEAISFTPIPDSYQKVVVTQKHIYAVLAVHWDALNYLSYSKSNGMISGFSMSYPSFSMTFPDGEPPAFEYRLGMYFEVEINGSTTQGEYWYDEEHIIYTPPTYSSQVFVNFPYELSLSDILRQSLEGADVQSIKMRLDLERVDGHGYLRMGDMAEYNITINE